MPDGLVYMQVHDILVEVDIHDVGEQIQHNQACKKALEKHDGGHDVGQGEDSLLTGLHMLNMMDVYAQKVEPCVLVHEGEDNSSLGVSILYDENVEGQNILY